MKTQLEQYQRQTEHLLQHFLDTSLTDTPARLSEAIRYATLNQGKRLRPALVFAAGEAFDVPLEYLNAPAVAIELLHSYSLVHDDLPAMDDDALRRGKPTCHIQYDEATAILVGDAQQCLAFEAIQEDTHLSAQAKVEFTRLLAKAAGPSGMIGGQIIDLMQTGHASTLEQIQNMHRLKTGALIKTALLIGACLGKQFDEKRPGLVDFGDRIGLAFQVQDDILDIESTSEKLGKTQGSDIANNKSTYPSLIGLEASKVFRDELIKDALNSLEEHDIHSDFLKALAIYVGNRTF